MRASQILSRGGAGEAPSVEPVNMQVRTAMSVPFAAHMLKRKEAPKVEPVELQVRTAMSVPFASYMTERKDAK